MSGRSLYNPHMADNLLRVAPVPKASDFAKAEAFYCEKLGFSKDWEYRPHPELPNPVYASFSREGVQLIVSSFSGDSAFGAEARLDVRDVDQLHHEFTTRGVVIDLKPFDQTWGNREMYIRDPDRNKLAFVQPLDTEPAS